MDLVNIQVALCSAGVWTLLLVTLKWKSQPPPPLIHSFGASLPKGQEAPHRRRCSFHQKVEKLLRCFSTQNNNILGREAPSVLLHQKVEKLGSKEAP